MLNKPHPTSVSKAPKSKANIALTRAKTRKKQKNQDKNEKRRIKIWIIASNGIPLHTLTTSRAFSSVGLEHLPYKQRVGGSTPSTPTAILTTAYGQ